MESTDVTQSKAWMVMDHLDERLANHGRWWAQTAGNAMIACLSRRVTAPSINGEYGVMPEWLMGAPC